MPDTEMSQLIGMFDAIKSSIHKIELRLERELGEKVNRKDLDILFESERVKREKLEVEILNLRTTISEMQISTKIYAGIAAAVAGLVSPAIAALVFRTIGLI